MSQSPMALLHRLVCMLLVKRAVGWISRGSFRVYAPLGATVSSSNWPTHNSKAEHVAHLVAGSNSPTVSQAIASIYSDDNAAKAAPVSIDEEGSESALGDRMTPLQLLELGSVWFRPHSANVANGEKVSA